MYVQSFIDGGGVVAEHGSVDLTGQGIAFLICDMSFIRRMQRVMMVSECNEYDVSQAIQNLLGRHGQQLRYYILLLIQLFDLVFRRLPDAF